MSDNTTEQVKTTLERIEYWFKNNAKNDKWHYKLYAVPYTNTSIQRTHFKTTNYTSKNQHESLENIEDAIYTYGPDAPRYFLIRHVINEKDAKNKDFFFKNPLFDPTSQKGYNPSRIGSLDSKNNFGNLSYLLEMERRHSQETQDLKQEILELKHERQMDDILAELEAIKETQASAVEKFFSRIEALVQTPVGQMAAIGLLGKLGIGNIPGIQEQIMGMENQEESQEQSPQAHSDNPTPNMNEQQLNNINIATAKLKKVFPSNFDIALLKLAVFCEDNPGYANELLGNSQGQNK